MTVTGSLEDLSFPDILQVIHVSRQSGTLVLSGSGEERRVRFQNGLVCGATLGEGGPELEDILVERGLIDGATLQRARDRSRRAGGTLSASLVAMGAVSQEMIEGIVRDELRSILRSLVLLQEGEFRFDMEGGTAAAREAIGVREGLGPETILKGLPVRGGVRPVGAGGGAREGSRGRMAQRVLVVLERSVLRLKLKAELARSGLGVETARTTAEGIGLARSLAEGGVPFSLVCDLLLADDGQRGDCRGGLELVRRIREMAPATAAIVLGEVRDPSIARETSAAGAAGYLLLPDLAEGGLDGVEEKLTRFCGEVREALQHPERLRAGGKEAGGGSVRVADPLSLLRGLIGEMRAEEESGIPLLVLRLAAEYFERGVLFAVRDGEACGAGAFEEGPDEGDPASLDRRIRGASLPLQRGSVLQRAVQERETYIGAVPPTKPNAALLSKLGGATPGEAALLPLLSGKHVFGILYGDNPKSGRAIGDVKALEIFLSQAGIALENAFLQRRIASLGRGKGPGSYGEGGSAGRA